MGLPASSLSRRGIQPYGATPVNVRLFGAKGDGVTDDTAAITAAWAASKILRAPLAGDIGRQASGGLFFPAGDYVFNGPALDAAAGSAIRIEGEGREVTRIRLGAGVYLLNTTNVVYSLSCFGLHFYGGKGTWKHSYPFVNVQGQYVFEDCDFVAYTEAAIVTLATDMPYFKVRNNVFYGTLTSKGFAHAGDADCSEIAGNSFLKNLYHVKLANGGHNVRIKDNDFIRFTNGGGAPKLTDVWIIPRNIITNSGPGCIIHGNKFGNENVNPADYRILVADEAAGVDFADKNHATTLSAGWWTAFKIWGNCVFMGAPANVGFVYSYTPNLANYTIENSWAGGPPPYVVQYDALVVDTADNRQLCQNVIQGTAFVDQSEQSPPVVISSRPGDAILDDPFAFFAGSPDYIPKYLTGFDPGFIDMGAALDTAAPLFVNAARNAVDDALGGGNASEIVYSALNGYAYFNTAFTNTVIGRRAWLEIDLKKSAVNPVNFVRIQLLGGASLAIKRYFVVPANWTTVRIPYIPRQTGTALAFRIEGADYSAGVRERVLIGRARIYHANEPQNIATRILENKAAFNPPNIASGAQSTTTITVNGAALGDFVAVSFSLDLQGLTLTGYVSAANTVTLVFLNLTGGALDLAAGTIRARVYKNAY